MHRSWCAEHPGHPSNERLEFLGDSVLGVIVTDHVYREHPDLDEGDLTEIRKTVVSSVALAERGRGPRRRGAPPARQGRGALRRPDEAVDPRRRHGGDHRRGVPRRRASRAPATSCSRVLGSRLATAPVDGADHKSRLQELAAHRFGAPPRYAVEATGPDHARTFFVTVSIADVAYGRGEGRSKKQAEQAAARGAACDALAEATRHAESLRETHHG